MLKVFEFGNIVRNKIANFEDYWVSNKEFPLVLDKDAWWEQFESYLALQPE